MNKTPEELAALSKKFYEEGYLIVQDVLSLETVEALKKRAAEITNDFDPSTHRTVFSTKDQEKVSNQYFLDSSSKVSFFFEPNAFDDDGNLKQDKMLSINKIGHALHDIDPVFAPFCRSDSMKEVIEHIIKIEDPRFVQSMYIYKQPRIGGEVGIHQDNMFIHTDPLSCCGLWFALEDATIENGCLWAVPGSHKEFPCQKRFIREGNEVSFDVDTLSHPPADEDFQALPVPKGAMILIHGGVFHKSFANLSSSSRQAFTMHVVDSTAEYSSSNWLQRPEMPFVGYVNPYVQ